MTRTQYERFGEVFPALIERYKDVSIIELNEIFKQRPMGNEAKLEAVEIKKIERLIENLSHLEDRASGVRNRIHSAEERLNGAGDGKDSELKEMAAYGSLDQALERVAKIHNYLDDCHDIMKKIEASV